MHKLLSLIVVGLMAVSCQVNATQTKGKVVKSNTSATKEYRIQGIMAWSEAKKNGFEFYPERAVRGMTKDGSSSIGNGLTINGNDTCHLKAKIIGGVNLLLERCIEIYPRNYPRSSYSFYHIFKGKKLKSGWKIKELKMSGSYQWTANKWRTNSDSLYSRIKLINNANQRNATKAMIKEVVLIGPANGKWQDAFDVM